MTKDRPEVLFVGAREVRVVPRGWQHPHDAAGRAIPLHPADCVFDDGERAAGAAGLMPSTSGLADGATEIVAYETVSEGTPISPAFPDTPAGRLDLVRYCAEHCTTFGDHRAGAEAWAAILFGDAAVALDGRVIGQG